MGKPRFARAVYSQTRFYWLRRVSSWLGRLASPFLLNGLKGLPPKCYDIIKPVFSDVIKPQ